MTDYSVYRFTRKEWIYETIRMMAVLCFTGLLFFESLFSVLILLPAGVFLMRDRRDKKREDRLSRLRSDFKEFVTSFSASVQAGYTMEQSVEIGMEDLRRMYPEGERAMIEELSWIHQQLKLQIPCDELFANLAERTGLEEIRSFAVVLGIGRRQGGNLVQITRRTAEHINKKIQVQMEMEQTVAGRLMEKNIMFVMPYFMVLYLRVTNASYMEILFDGLTGHGLMLFCLILLCAADKWAESIVKIKL